jgi:hypothetical protein
MCLFLRILPCVVPAIAVVISNEYRMISSGIPKVGGEPGG